MGECGVECGVECGMECGVVCGMECKVSSVKWGVKSVECGMWSGVWSGLWSKVWSKVMNSAERVQKELRRMKVINNREKVFDKPIDTHYVRDNSRYGKWKSQMERNGYRRSDSRKGFWRNGAAASSQRYIIISHIM